MNKKRHVITVHLFLVGVFLLGTGMVQQESAEGLYEKGIYLEETKGDLEGAISLYQKIVDNFSDVRRARVARALVQMGKS